MISLVAMVLQIMGSVEFWKLALPLFSAVIAWYINERQKRLLEQYQRKEASYRELVRALRGFYEGTSDSDKLKADFLDQLNQSWLYCPDNAILKGYEFLESVKQGEDNDLKQRAMGDFVAAIYV